MKRRLATLGLLATLLALLPVVARAESLSDFAYQVAVTITNRSGTALTTAPVAVAMNMDNLVTGSFLQNDAGDLRPVDAAQAARVAVAQSMGSNNVTLWQEVASLANNGSTTYQEHMGDSTATRTQAWAGYGADGLSAAHNAAHNITDLLDVYGTLTRWDGWKAITTTGLVADWQFTECVAPDSATATDWSGNGHTLTGQGNARNKLDTSRTPFSSAFCSWRNDGTAADYWSIADAAALRPATISLEFWLYDDSGAAVNNIFEKGDLGAGTYTYAVLLTAADTVEFLYTSGGGGVTHTFVTTTGITPAEWEHVAISFTYGTGTSMKVYINGVDAGGSWTLGNGNAAPDTPANQLRVGADGLNAYTGSLAELRLWNTARTAAQVLANYQRYALNRRVPLAMHRGTNVVPNRAGQDGYALYLEYDAGCAGTLARIRGTVDTAGINVCMSALAGASDVIQLSYTNPNATLLVDAVTVAGPTNLGVGAIATGTAPLIASNGLAGLLTWTNVTNNGTSAAQYSYQPTGLTETQKGLATNGWVWTGTVDDVSATGNDATYSMYRNQASITVSVGPVQLKNVSISIATEPTVNVMGVTNITPVGLQPTIAFPGMDLFPSPTSLGLDAGVHGRDALWFVPVFLVSMMVGGGLLLIPPHSEILGGLGFSAVWAVAWKMGLEEWWISAIVIAVTMSVGYIAKRFVLD